MEKILKFSKNIIEELNKLVSAGNPVLSSDKGDLFVSDTAPVSVIRLKIPVTDYLAFIESLDTEKPKRIHLIPINNESFQIIVNAPVVIENDSTLINGDKVCIL